jgi:Histidine kinase-, DNA gyrase B-, and HSP90-like ATPase
MPTMNEYQTHHSIDVTPPKRFFVEMLTRDIELEDAILDLLDNCVDGAVRLNANRMEKPDPAHVYSGFSAEICLSDKSFSIIDNCGGIPPKVAADYAFRFGRPREEIDSDLQTVGVYGIGMKRALFKLGQNCTVHSRNPEGSFTVNIDKNWVQSPQWNINLDELATQALDRDGVMIEVRDLHPGISSVFDTASSAFEGNLIKKIQDHYAYIIQKGFSVRVNGKRIQPNLIQTIVGDPEAKSGFIAPYIYETEHEGVCVHLTMGIYAPFPTDTELEESLEGKRSKNTAGWSIICNDRVVLSHDTTHRTGWGEAGVPNYHSQFVMLSGAVEFTSNDSSKLPITTTKRGINLDSPLYSEVKNVMREALKHFTSFTNHWKSDSEERAALQKNASSIDIRCAAEHIAPNKWQSVRKNLKGRRFVPDLPKPITTRTHSRITFERPIETIESVREFLEIAPARPISEIGASAFDWVAGQAKL